MTTTPQAHTRQIRKALNTAFDNVTLQAFCLDYFTQVYDTFNQDMRQDRKIMLLLDHCRRQPTGFEVLLDAACQEYSASNLQFKQLEPLIDVLKKYEANPQGARREGLREESRQVSGREEKERKMWGVVALPRYYVPREAELERLRQALGSQDQVALTALTGMGGVGKTVLACALAYDAECARKYSDGVLWTTLGPERPKADDQRDADYADLLMEWAEPLGLTEAMQKLPKTEMKSNFLREKIRSQRLLLVVDDVWHIKPARLLASLCGPQCGLLITTRFANIAADLGIEAVPLDQLQRDEALKLLTVCRGRLSPPDLPLAEELLQRLGYHPMAIRLAGAQLSLAGRNWDTFLRSLRHQQGESLAIIDLEPTARESSLQVCFDLSYNSLSQDAQRCYRWLGVMAADAPFRVEDMQALWKSEGHATAHTLHSLLDAALLEELSTADGRRYRQHLLLREDALRRQTEEERISVLSHHASIYCNVAEQAVQAGNYRPIAQDDAQIQAILQRAWRAWQDEKDHIGQGLTYPPREAFKYLNGLAFNCYSAYWSLQGQYIASKRWLPRAINAAKQAEERLDEAKHLGHLSIVQYFFGEVEEAIKSCQQALEISREIGDEPSEADRLNELGVAYADLGKINISIHYYQEALEISRKIKDKKKEGYHLGNLAKASLDSGQVEEAIDLCEQALAIHRETGYQLGKGWALNHLGSAYQKTGQFELAIKLHEEARDISQKIGAHPLEGECLEELGKAYKELGQVNKAHEVWREALAIYEKIKSHYAERMRGLLPG